MQKCTKNEVNDIFITFYDAFYLERRYTYVYLKMQRNEQVGRSSSD